MKHKKSLSVFLMGLFISLLFLFPNTSLANESDEMVWGGYYEEFQSRTGMGTKDPREMIVEIVRIALGFLGIIAVSLILMAGFKLMVSGGNEDAVAEAKAIMFNGIMGLIIILASMSLANFVITSILNATTMG